MQSTASSIIMKLSWAWYFRSYPTHTISIQTVIVKADYDVDTQTFRIFPVVKFHTSMNPSTDPVTRYWPSGEKREHSTWDFWPNCRVQTDMKLKRHHESLWCGGDSCWCWTLMCLFSCVGKRSSSTSFTAALPLNKSMVIPGGRRPWCCCHFRDFREKHTNTIKPSNQPKYRGSLH